MHKSRGSLPTMVFLLLTTAASLAYGQTTWDTHSDGDLSGDATGRAADKSAQLVTVVLAPNPAVQHRRPEFARDLAIAGSGHTYVLGQDLAWAYDQIAEDDNPESSTFFADRLNIRSSPTVTYPGLDYPVNVPGRRALLTYADLLAVIPPDAHIVSAKINVTLIDGDASWGFARTDTLATVLMSGPDDGIWRQHYGLNGGLSHYGYANWDYQVLGVDQGGNAARGHPATSMGAWNPPLDSRREFWEYGDWFDWCSAPRTLGVDSLFTIDITDCVQGIANGAENNGFFTYIMNSDSSAHWDFGIGAWEGTAATRAPWITIQYLTRPYVSPFPDGAEWAFVFSTDDEVARANRVYTQIFAERDLAYTIYVRADKVGQPRYASWADLVSWHSVGMEIGSHSRFHWGTRPDGTPFVQPNAAKVWYGLNTYFATWGDVGTYVPGATLAQCTTGFDSLLVDSDPSWLYDGAYNTIQDSLRCDPNWGKSLATPGNFFRPEVLKATQMHDYRAVRSGQSYALTLTDGNRPFGFKALYFRGNDTDTLWAGLTGHHQRQPRNLVWQATNYASYDFVGQQADTMFSGHLDSVRLNLRRAVKIARAQNVNVINLFTHSLKSDRSYAYGINTEEMEALLDVVEEEHGWVARASDYGRWCQEWATPVATPLAYAQDDSFKFSAADRVWYQLDGVGNRFIRGFSLGGVAGSDDPVPDPTRWLASNYPNPFNPQTTIVYNVRAAGRVRLRIYDARGALVRDLVDGYREAGSYEVPWQAEDDRGRGVAAGVYFCALEAGADRATRKLVVVR